MYYIGEKDEVVIKVCEQCHKLIAYKSNGKSQPLFCQDCGLADGIEYINTWDIVLTDTDGKDYVIPLGTDSSDALKTARMCNNEIKKGAKQAQNWTKARIVPQGWPH